MSRHISRRFFLGTVAAFTAAPVVAAPPAASLRPVMRDALFYRRAVRSVDEIVRVNELSGDLAFALADAKTGEWLETENETLATPPASTAKSITALYALDALGADHRFQTRLIATGGITEGVVQGDLILAGGGDPTLDTDGLANMAAKLKAAGVTGVKGALKVYEASLPVFDRIDPDQPDHVGYNPGVSGLSLNFNRLHFEWKRQGDRYTVTMEGRTEAYRPPVKMAAMRIRDRETPVYTYENRDGRDNWTVARGALGRAGSRWLPVRKPGLYAGEVFQVMAAGEGLKLGRPQMIDALPQGQTMVSRNSAPLRNILRDMLNWSVNVTAEMVGLAATKKQLGNAQSLRGSAAAMNAWATEALGMQNPQLVDHSGLGDDSLMTALDMTRAMVKVLDSELPDILKVIPMRDEKRKLDRNHPLYLKVRAKTGTLNFVSTLSGYMTGRDGRLMAFTTFAANPAKRAKITRALREGPPGGVKWNRSAKRVHQELLERWDVLYASP